MEKQKNLFFSIIVPAHNEELYIENTLRHLVGLSYPKEKYEVIVVENGSTDRTYEIAKRFENEGIVVLQSKTGVSRARNCGIDAKRKEGDWVIFLDADCILEASFLEELNTFLAGITRACVVGTVSIRPLPQTRKGRIWFALYDIGHRVTRSSYSITILKSSLVPPIRYDEALIIGEDLDVIAQARRFGPFFFMWTRAAYTSTRRFEKLGWWRVFFHWVFVGMLPIRLQRRFTYKVIR